MTINAVDGIERTVSFAGMASHDASLDASLNASRFEDFKFGAKLQSTILIWLSTVTWVRLAQTRDVYYATEESIFVFKGRRG